MFKMTANEGERLYKITRRHSGRHKAVYEIQRNRRGHLDLFER